MDSVATNTRSLENPKELLKSHFQLVGPFIYKYENGSWSYKVDIARSEYKKYRPTGAEIFFTSLEDCLKCALNLDEISASYQNYEILENVTISNCNYDELIISGGLFSGVKFESVHFQDCTFFGSRIEHCQFKNCTFTNCKFHFSHILHTHFKNCQFEDSFYEISPIKKCSFEESELDTKTQYFIAKYDDNKLIGQHGRSDLNEGPLKMDFNVGLSLEKELKDAA
ncbi:MAG: pentapeptide repeat-containing protein [Bacteriovoracaceae bacterium]